MIEEIKRIFEDIAKAIIEMGGTIDECTSPEDYAEAIKNLSGNNAVLFVPVFRSSDIKPTTPTTPLNVSTPNVYPDGWSTPDGLTGNIGMSYTIVSASTTYVPWTEPILIKTIKDVAPETYDDATTRTFLIYLELPDVDLTPSVPIGGTWNVTENRLEGTITSELYKNDAYIGRTIDTGSTDNNHVKGCYTWMSMGTFIAESGELIGPWSDPICINLVRDGKDGKDGINGIDGQSIEFIYKLCANEDTARLEPTPESDPDTDDFVPDGGTDHPSGIDPINYRVEIMCTRKKGKNGKGEDFIGPTIGAMGGEDGTDGDGIEYIFRVASQQEVIDNGDGTYQLKPEFWPPTCAGTIDDGCANGYISTVRRDSESTLTDEELLELYQQNEFVPGHLEGHPDAASIGWDRNGTDDPLDVSPSQPFEFCSIRKYDGDFSNIDGTKGTWRGFSEPVLGNKFWSGYAPVFTSFAFTRSRLKLGSMRLEGGDVSNPLPDPQMITQTIDGTQVTETINWFDTVPGPSDFPNDETMGHAPVGMTTRQFGSIDPDAEEQDQSWESPRLMADSRFHNTEYSASDVVTLSTRLPRFDERINDDYPFIDDNDPEGVNEAAGRNYCQTNGLGIWGDENDVSHPKWMATCSFISGKGTEWSLTQCKGEKGEDGDGVQYVYKLFDHELTDAERTSNIPAKPASQTSDGEWIPTGGSDDPLAPTVSMPYCYCSIIKRINGVGGNFEKLGLGAKGAKDGDPGNDGHIGPRMRMRNWKTDYSNSDSEGQDGWYSGDEDDAKYYDIAIGPVAEEGITITNASSNADRLGRCKKKLPYDSSAITADSNPSTLTEYFVQAVGWDFVATKLLLADKINANQIDVNGLSAKTIVTDVTDGSYASIAGNTIELKKNGTTKCKISGNPITVNASQGIETVGNTPLGYRFAGGQFQNGFNKIIDLGAFEIQENAQHQVDTIKSTSPQQLSLEFIGRWKNDVGPNTTGNVGVYGTIQLKARNQETQRDIIGYTAGYGDNVLLFSSPQTTDPGQIYRSGDNIPNGRINIDTTDPHNFPVGKYSLILDVTILDGCSNGVGLGAYFEDMELYLSQYSNDGGTTGVGAHYPIIKTEAVSSEIQYTDIGTDGFAHVLDGNNYFKVQKESGNNYLTLEFLSGGQYGLKIDGTGIYKTISGTSGGTSL